MPKQVVTAIGFTLLVTDAQGQRIYDGFAVKPYMFPWGNFDHDALLTVTANFADSMICTIASKIPGCRGRQVGDWLEKLWEHEDYKFTAHKDNVGCLLCRTWHE